MYPHHCEHLKSCTKEYKEQVKRGWKCHIEKIKLQEELYVFKTQYLIPHSYSTNCVPFSHILPLEQIEETRSGTLPGYKHYQYKYTFYGQDHINEFQSTTKIISQGQSHTQNYLQF
jgi:hypothetical protein